MQADTTSYFVVWWVLFECSSFDYFPKYKLYFFILSFLFYLYLYLCFLLRRLFFIFSATDLKHKNLGNYSARLVLTILSSFFFGLLKLNLFFAV